MSKARQLNRMRQRRAFRVRKATVSSPGRPRLTVFRSHKHIACQVIDDETGKTLASASSRDTNLRDQVKYGGNKAAAQLIGKVIAERTIAAGIQQVCFDRGHNKYHGRIAALANAAREGGLKF